MRRAEFEKLVEEAIAAVPERFRQEMANLAFVIEDLPPAGKDADGEEGDLLGLYEGIPLTERTFDESGILPDKITVYMSVVEDEAEETSEPLDKVVRETVWHEIAHYFGFDEDAAERLCDRWEERWKELGTRN